MKRSTVATILVSGLLALAVSGVTMAHRMGDDDDYRGRGMMGGQGMMQGGQPGFGMQGYGMMGPGMMGPGTMGPGMMGPGMMGPGMMGPGMMSGGIGPYAGDILGLSDEQREQLRDIQREHARESWELMQDMHERAGAMMELHSGEAVDPEAVGRAFDELAVVHRRMLVQQARMHNRMRDMLTEEQRERIRQMWHYGQ